MSAPTTHARGPWRMSGKRIYETRKKEGWRDAYTMFPVAEILGSQNSEEENKANAHLIAAAPDLLEALRNVAEIMSGADYSHVKADMARAICRRAISAAEGGQE